MSYTQTVDAIVLRTFDIGEADRFCLLFTREKGRVAARATAVRKPKSSMGGALLPCQYVTVQLKEWKNGYIIQSAETRDLLGVHRASIRWFTEAQQAMELLMGLTQDDEPLPDVFHATLRFLAVCGDDDAFFLLAYTIRLLHLLGLLPAESHVAASYGLLPEDLAFLQAARRGALDSLPPLSVSHRLQVFCDGMMQGQLSSPLKAPAIAAAME
ncbi:MAG: repair protein RecO [Candidatus Peribacteria bacterium]|nr:repair protein RecO [Candidatus Peribacteria bacterium]